MKITNLRIYVLDVPLITPFKTALRTVEAVSDVIVKLETDSEEIGFGEAPPTKAITGETKESIIATLDGPIRHAIVGKEVDDLEELCKALDNCIEHNTSAKAAADIAIYDLYGKLHKQSVAKLFGAARNEIITDITISVNEPEEMASDAKKAIVRGFKTLKVKVGSDPTKDVDRLIAIREAIGSDYTIRIDANQGWKPLEAIEILTDMQNHGIDLELVEQPVVAKDLDGLKYVTMRSPVPVVADESVFSPMDAYHIFKNDIANMCNIKLMKCGGLHNALKIAEYAEEFHKECMLGCMLEAKVSVNAAVQLACAKNVITKIDLDGPLLCSEDPVIGGCILDAPIIRLNDAPGLGVTSIEGLKLVK